MKMDHTELVFKILEVSGEPMNAGEIAGAANPDKKEVDKAMQALKKEGRIVSPKRCFWTTA